MAVRHLTYLGKEWWKGDASCTSRNSLKVNIAYLWPDKGSHLAKKNIQDQKLQEDGSRRKGLPHLKQHLNPFFSRAVSNKRAMLSLTVIGFTMVAMTASKCNIPYCYALKIISGIRKVVYSCGAHDPM